MQQETKNTSIKNNSLLPISAKKHDKLSLLCASALLALLPASNSYANPTGGEVAAGGATMTNPSAGHLVVNQTTDKVIINWKDFNIAEGEWTQFVQNNSNSVALNRINNGNPTEILGKLSANGKLMVVNPNGVFFGANSRVDVAGLVASTADTTDADFLAGKVNLSIAGNPDAAIINKGSITAADGGLVALVAPSVRNDGIIQANMGTVALASAQTASVDFYGDNLYSFALDKEATAAGSGVTNSGIVSVGGGKVLMTAKVAKDVVDNVINNTGIIEASSAHMEGGTVVLDGGTGNVHVSGKINASGDKGGKVTVTGENITVAGADIDASGKNGGGEVKIGGDYRGGGTLAHAKKVSVDSATKIDVSAKETGNGGTAVVWSDEVTSFNGSIFGTGGVNGGNGGVAEVSSKGDLHFNGFADLHADAGASGSLLLDPTNLFIGNWALSPVFDIDGKPILACADCFVSVVPFVNTLNTGTNVIAEATNNVSVLADMIWSGSGSFTINAGNNVIIEADIKSSYNGTSTQGAININAGNNIQMGNADISTKGGDIKTTSIGMAMSGSTIKSSLGNVVIGNTGRFGSNMANVLSGQTVTLNQSTAGFIQNAIDAVGATGVGGAYLNLGSGVWNEDIVVNQGNFHITGQGSLNTIIRAPIASTNPVVAVNNVNDVTISGLQVDGGEVGIQAVNSDRFTLTNSLVNHASLVGVQMADSTSAKISGNYIVNNHTGLQSSNTDFLAISGNGFSDNINAMSFDGDTNLRIQSNAIYGTGVSGIALNNVVGSPIVNNTFKNLNTAITVNGGSSVVISGNKFEDVVNGVKNIGSLGLHVDNNIFSNLVAGNNAIFNLNGNKFTANGNTIDNFTNGIVSNGASIATISNNKISGFTDDGILVAGGDHVLVKGNTLSGAAGADNGIRIENINQATVSNNDVSNTATGVNANNITGLYVLSNILHGNFVGAGINASNNTVFNDNTLTDNFVGASFSLSNNVATNNNDFVDNGTGLSFTGSNNAVSTSDAFTGNATGIFLSNSLSAFINLADITNLAGTGIGINITNGSGGTLVEGTNITGGDIGVLVDGAGSSMQFSSNTSTFSSMNNYFILQNNAMFASGSTAQADSLDASQQTFDGIRGVDFTPTQLAAAEGITTDVEDGIPTIGNVFYKIFTPIAPIAPTPAFNLLGADQFVIEPLNFSLFSYAGRTITPNPIDAAQQFDVNTLNLSLLGAGGAAPTVTPAVAGLTPSQLGGLEPAAGGNNQQAQTLASLEPAAGGEANCGNSFLGAGFNSNNFDAATCSVKQQ